mgnify:CR=1 FL=1
MINKTIEKTVYFYKTYAEPSIFVKKEQERPLKENQAWVHPDDFETFVFPKPQQKMVAFLNK